MADFIDTSKVTLETDYQQTVFLLEVVVPAINALNGFDADGKALKAATKKKA